MLAVGGRARARAARALSAAAAKAATHTLRCDIRDHSPSTPPHPYTHQGVLIDVGSFEGVCFHMFGSCEGLRF